MWHSQYEFGADDLVLKEFHLPVRESVELVIRSKDVIHSAYMPHLRAQMNAGPGMSTVIHMKPTITTDSMRTIVANPDFEYLLMCNKICGANHFNMKMPLVIEPAGAYTAWLAQQKGFQTAEPAKAEVVPADTTIAPANTTAQVATPPNEPNTH